MPERHLLPIPLPNGRDGGKGRLTVYFAHRLKVKGRLDGSGGPQVAGYPELIDWPRTMRDVLTLQVFVNGAAASFTRTSVDPSSRVWTTAFAPDNPVRAHRFKDWSGTPLLPMATSDFSEAVLDLYVELARQYPSNPPSGDDIVGIPASALLLAGSDDEPGPGSLAEAVAYSAPMAEARQPEAEPSPPQWDFHEYVSLLGHHPELLRHLGLAVDLEVDLSTGTDPVEVTVRARGYEAQFGPDGAVEVPVAMQTTPRFLALPNPSYTEQIDGFLELRPGGSDDPDHQRQAFLSIVDPHLAAMRLKTVADQLDDQERPADGDLPALSTRALSLVRPDLVTAWANRTIRAAELEDEVVRFVAGQGGPPKTYGEDATIGHRIDVLDGGEWRSLFERRTVDGYRFPTDDTLVVEPDRDEGWATTTLITEEDENLPEPDPEVRDPIVPTATRRIDDAVYRWDGWSGAASAPGGAVAGDQVAEADANEPAPSEPVQVKVDYEVVPATLPELKFGDDYRMRARCVTLAGDSVPLDEKTPDGADTAVERFGRLEPIASPVVVRHEPRPVPGVGDSARTIVIRSELDQPHDTVAPADRLLFPPRIGADVCELHGLPAGGHDPASYAILATRDALQLADQGETDPETGEIVVTGPARPDVQYLCDPAAAGVRVWLPDIGDEVVVGLDSDWPERRALRLVLMAGPNDRVVGPDADTSLAVHLDQAEIASGTVSFAIDEQMLEHFALWQRLGDDGQDAQRRTVLDGGHWMMSARTGLTLVHAVRVPLAAPSVSGLSAARELGSTDVTLDGSLTAHRNSTGQLSLTARWTDPIDDPSQDAPVNRTAAVALGDIHTTRSDSDVVDVSAFRARLPDSKHHVAEVRVEAFSSFSHYFTEQRDILVDARRVVIDRRGVVAGSVDVTMPDGKSARATGAAQARRPRPASAGAYTVDGPTGTLTIRDADAIPLGTVLQVRYIPLPVSRNSGEHAEVFTMDVPNTVAPPPPAVHSALPAFARSGEDTDGRRQVDHAGRVIRVYVDRPWFVSGPGELLGVVLALDDADLATASWVARDPVVAGEGPRRGPTAAELPRAVHTVTTADGRYQVAGHEVRYAPDQGRWFADVEITGAAAYRPFARLVLARLQPVSVEGAAVSTTVTVEPVRLGVDRQVVVHRDKTGVDVDVSGPDHDGVPDATAKGALLHNIVRATVQQTEPGIDDPDLRWVDTAVSTDLVRVDHGADSSWTGRLEPVDLAVPVRILIEELEPTMRRNGSGPEVAHTVVHVEAVELPVAATA